MSIQEKFEKAVNVIRNLPKHGSYQPSHELQLRFYAYYKQATEGCNCQPRPNFWVVVKRAKWDAWAKLGNMTKEEAMMHYVEELRKIVETMSYTDNVANFLNSLDDFYEHVPAEDLEMLVGPIIEKIRSRPNSPLSGSPLASRDTSPSRATASSHEPLRLITGSLETSPTSSYSASPLPPDTDDDEEEDNFLDTQTEPDRAKDGASKNATTEITSHEVHLPEVTSREDHVPELELICPQLHPQSFTSNNGTNNETNETEVSGLNVPVPAQPVQVTISSIINDLNQLKNRVQSVEDKVLKERKLTMGSSNSISQSDQGKRNIPAGIPASTADIFKRAVDQLVVEMNNIQQRMTYVERQAEISLVRKRSGSVIPTDWGLPLKTTAILLAWPIVLLLISKWFSNRRNH